MADTSQRGAPVTMGPAGFWLDANGNVAATDQQGQPQVTPGMAANPEAEIHYDAEKDLDYNFVNGKKVYRSPVEYGPGGEVIYKTSKSGGPISDTGGGLVHGGPGWNPLTGEWDVNLDMGKILSIGAAAGIAAPYIVAALGTEAGGAGAAGETAAGGAGTTAAVTPTAFEALPGAITLGPEATAGLGAAGAAGGAGATSGGMGAIGSTLLKAAGPIGSAVSNASSGAGNTRRADFDTNVQGQSAYEQELNNRSKLESDQRQQALKDLYRQSYAANRKPGPNNAQGLTPYSADYMSGLSAIEKQGLARLQQPAQYGTNSMPAIPPYVPTAQGGMEKAGSIIGPALSTAEKIAQMYYGSK